MVQGDETGWRQDGSNGYVWTFSTPSERYFLRRGRDKGVVDEVLDSSFSGGLVSDFYPAYNHYPGLKQRCWAHLLRDIHDLKGLYPEDAGLAQWAEAVHQVYTEAKASVLPRAQPGHRTQLMLEEKLMVLARPFLKDPLAVQGKLCRRMERFIKELFVFVSDPAVPSDNNAAERSLRHLVTSRKISGGTRSGQGTDSNSRHSRHSTKSSGMWTSRPRFTLFPVTCGLRLMIGGSAGQRDRYSDTRRQVRSMILMAIRTG